MLNMIGGGLSLTGTSAGLGRQETAKNFLRLITIILLTAVLSVALLAFQSVQGYRRFVNGMQHTDFTLVNNKLSLPGQLVDIRSSYGTVNIQFSKTSFSVGQAEFSLASLADAKDGKHLEKSDFQTMQSTTANTVLQSSFVYFYTTQVTFIAVAVALLLLWPFILKVYVRNSLDWTYAESFNLMTRSMIYPILIFFVTNLMQLSGKVSMLAFTVTALIFPLIFLRRIREQTERRS
jgi:hypothetical protein